VEGREQRQHKTSLEMNAEARSYSTLQIMLLKIGLSPRARKIRKYFRQIRTDHICTWATSWRKARRRVNVKVSL